MQIRYAIFKELIFMILFDKMNMRNANNSLEIKRLEYQEEMVFFVYATIM